MKRISLTTPALLILLTLYAPHFTIASSHTPTFNTIEALPSPPCLTGNYTIGPGGDYTTFSLAANHLNDQGVCGTVVFNVLSGTYTENFNLTDLAGVSASNTITFQAQSGDPADVILQTTSINDVIILHNADHITFKDLTISYMGSGTQSAIELQDDSDHITVTNCVLNGGSSTSTANTNALIYSNESIAADQCDHFILENSTLNGAANGIYFSNSNGNNVGTRISGNSFTDQFRNGVYLDEFEAIQVLDNTFTNGSNANSSYTAIHLNDCNNASQVIGNRITSTYIKYGIVLGN